MRSKCTYVCLYVVIIILYEAVNLLALYRFKRQLLATFIIDELIENS